MFRSISVILLILASQVVFSQNVKIKGNAKEYSGESITFYTFQDQITYTEKKIAECKVDENGNFECSFPTKEILYIFSHIGIYEAFLFIEPGKEYEILLPEKQAKTMANKLNPYFEPTYYHIGVENSSEKELNYQLAFFDEVYNIMNENTSYAIYISDRSLDVEKEIAKVDSLFFDVDISYFKDFKKYKYASYKYLANHQKSKSISKNYFLNKKIQYNNPAYMNLLNQLYKDYIQYFGRTDTGKKVFTDIGREKSITLLKETLGRDSVLTNDTLKELVILKCLHDEFYNDLFSRSAMLTVLDSLEIQTKIDEHKLIAKNIKEKVTKLMVGYKPPKFELYNKDGKLVSLDNFKGKYVYLGFCTTVSYACIKEFEMLRNFYEHHKNHFEIVFICMDEDLEQMKHFVERKEYPYTFLHYGNQSTVFKDYDIRAFPTYYFINKDGELEMSPAPSTDQHAEQMIFRVMRRNGDI